MIDLSVACLQHHESAQPRMHSFCFLRHLLCLITLAFSIHAAHAWNATGHREVVAVAWAALDAPTRDRVNTLIASQALITKTQNQHGDAAWMAAALWPDELRDQAEPSRAMTTPPVTQQQWLAHASSGEATRYWHFADRNIARPFNQQPSHGLLEQALTAQLGLLSDASLPHHKRAIALAWVSHLVADAHQPLHCASRSVPGHPGELDAGGNLGTVLDAGRKPPEPISLHRWWDELPGHARPETRRFDHDLAVLLRQSLKVTDNDLAKPPRTWIEESFTIARDQVYPGLQPDPDVPGAYLIDQDYWLAGRDMTQTRLAQAGRRLAYVVTQALKDLP